MKKRRTVSIYNKKLSIGIFVSILLVLLVASFFYIRASWFSAVKESEAATLQLATTAVAGMPKSRIASIIESEDASTEEYGELKDGLLRIADNDDIRFAYLYIVRDGAVYLVVDSEPQGSPDHVEPWFLYEEADPSFLEVYHNGKATVTDAVEDRWGEWVSVLIPIQSESGEVLAVFGMDYPVKEWYHYSVQRTYMAIVIAMWVLLLYTGLFHILTRNKVLALEKNKLQKISKQLGESEYLLRSIFDQANIGIAVVKEYTFFESQDNSRPTMNPAFAKILGRTVSELVNINWKEITHPDDLNADVEQFEKLKKGDINGYEMDKRFLMPDGSYVWVRMIISCLNLFEFKNHYHLCLITDITNNKMLEKGLSDSERSKALLLNNLPGMSYQCKYDKDWTMIYVSVGCFALTGYHPEELIQNESLSFNEVIVKKYRKLLWDEWKKAVKKHKKMSAEYEIVTASGTKKWVWEQGQAVYDDKGNAVMLEGLILDITTRKVDEMRLKYLNEHDSLTGLSNLNSFNEFIKRETAFLNEYKQSIILLNVRKFSMLKTNFGYRFGEKLIKDVALCIKKLENKNTKVFHISTDQYLIFVKEYQNRQDIEAMCKKMVNRLHDGIFNKAVNYNIGIMELSKETAYDVEALLRNLAIAANSISDSEDGGYRFFNEEMKESYNRQLALREALTNLANGKEDGCLYMVYQPIVDLKTDTISGFEALARYKHPQLGFVSPVEFIPLIEKYQLILPLGNIMMQQVFQFALKVSQQNPALTMAFNISAIQLLSDSFYQSLTAMLTKTGVNPNRIVIEITESIFIDNYQEVNNRLTEIGNLGIKVAIDDFGTGYSSLSREKELKVNCLKIDKQFIDSLLTDDPEKSIVSDIISMAHKLGHSVVAEGVETEEQKKYLIQYRCDLMQGYWYSKPLEEQAALEFVRKKSD